MNKMDKKKLVKKLLNNQNNQGLRYTIKEKKTNFKCTCGGALKERKIVYDKNNKLAWAMEPLANITPTYICSKCKKIEGFYSLKVREILADVP